MKNRKKNIENLKESNTNYVRNYIFMNNNILQTMASTNISLKFLN